MTHSKKKESQIPSGHELPSLKSPSRFSST